MKDYFSEARWNIFRGSPEESEEETLVRYLWNVELCEALYPTLHFMEIFLRNRIDHAITSAFGSLWLSETSNILHERERGEIQKVYRKIQERTTGFTRDLLIAELQLGFWTGLFKRHYRNILWPKCIKATFPYLERTYRTPEFIYPILDETRRLRNRVFHHEPILQDPLLRQKHENLYKIISWISSDLVAIAKRVDRFTEVVAHQS